MTIHKWHVGKLVLLWAWGLALCVVIIQIIIRTTDYVLGFALLAVVLAILVTLSVITWKWFSGKEDG